MRGGILSRYIKDIIYGANDGVVTTFAVVAGAVGASLSTRIILIMGFANLFADGFSMAASDYLGTKSEKEVERLNGKRVSGSDIKPALLTFISFAVAGSIPLLPYIFLPEGNFYAAFLATATALFLTGSLLGYLVLEKHWLTWGLRMLAVGGIASVIAFVIGRLIGSFIGA